MLENTSELGEAGNLGIADAVASTWCEISHPLVETKFGQGFFRRDLVREIQNAKGSFLSSFPSKPLVQFILSS